MTNGIIFILILLPCFLATLILTKMADGNWKYEQMKLDYQWAETERLRYLKAIQDHEHSLEIDRDITLHHAANDPRKVTIRMQWRNF